MLEPLIACLFKFSIFPKFKFFQIQHSKADKDNPHFQLNDFTVIFNTSTLPPPKLSNAAKFPELKSIISLMLVKDPSSRFAANELLQNSQISSKSMYGLEVKQLVCEIFQLAQSSSKQSKTMEIFSDTLAASCENLTKSTSNVSVIAFFKHMKAYDVKFWKIRVNFKIIILKTNNMRIIY